MELNRNDKYWFVAYVKSCQERKASEALSKAGYEHYLPVQRVQRKWSDRTKIVEQLVLPRMVFVRATPSERLKVFDLVPQICGFINDKGPYNPAVVRDSELESFRTMVERSGLTITHHTEPLAPGDKVRVVNGPLAGCEFELVSVGGKHCAAARLGQVGTLLVEIDLNDIKKI